MGMVSQSNYSVILAIAILLRIVLPCALQTAYCVSPAIIRQFMCPVGIWDKSSLTRTVEPALGLALTAAATPDVRNSLLAFGCGDDSRARALIH